MFLVLEGIDGAGKGRQRLELISYLQEHGVRNVDGIEFPDHQGVLYRSLIKPHLLDKIKIPNKALFLSFALDQLLLEPRINKARGSKAHHFICDGYFTTNLVYNCLVDKSLSLNQALKFASIFVIPEPDLNIYIDVEPEIALKRKSSEAGHEQGLDYNERDIQKQHKIRQGFLTMVEKNIFGKWIIVDGRGGIGDVKNSIIDKLNESGLIKINN